MHYNCDMNLNECKKVHRTLKTTKTNNRGQLHTTDRHSNQCHNGTKSQVTLFTKQLFRKASDTVITVKAIN